STVMTRVVAGLGWDLLDDVHAKITLRKNDRAWGTQGAAGQMNTTTNDQAISGATGLFGTTFINEASVKVDKLFGALDTTVGRQFWGNSGDLIAAWGPKNNYGLYVTAIDAVSAMYANDMIEFAGIAGKAVDAPIGTAANAAIVNDTTATGIDVGVKKLPPPSEPQPMPPS
ncbi:MAG: hypothetical protein NTX64_14980, partial [Elusimicrobia bacterium]|nr:hypothetical protein [Elusimicrobiota bacterium]